MRLPLAGLLAAAVLVPLAPAAPAVAQSVPTPGTSVPTLQVVGELAETPARRRAGVDAWQQCRSLDGVFAATARSGRSYGLRRTLPSRQERMVVEGTLDGQPHPVELDVTVVTCRFQFLGPVSASTASQALAVAQARLPDWGFSLRPDRAHGALLVFRLPRVSTHTLSGTLLNRVAPLLGARERTCSGGDHRRYAALGVVTADAIPAAALSRARAAAARAAGLPVEAVRVTSPWGATPFTCLDPRH